MPKVGPFEEHAARYEAWFERNRFAYQSELRAVKSLLPPRGIGIEIGVGTGRFAAPLGLRIGIEPSTAMAMIARQRGIQVVQAVAEALPFMDETFDFVLMVTTLCFLDDVGISFREVHRVLKRGGFFLVGLIDRESPLGRMYQEHQSESPFYAEAQFYSVQEVVSFMKNSHFEEFKFAQTIFRDLSSLHSPEIVRQGYGEGSFVVLRARKSVD
ncbi:MAG: methyltransferase domain-containing protein [Pirellulales bacterium]|nr:methyltransferase domain-containing protein [Pirellulales bacterium]